MKNENRKGGQMESLNHLTKLHLREMQTVKEEEKDIEVVKEALNLSSRRANEIIDILTDEDMEILRSRVFKGGVK